MAQDQNKTQEQLDREKMRERHREMFREFYETKDHDLRNQLIEENLYIADILTKRYLNRGIDYDDIYQVASIGLINAVDRYDPTMGYEFSSFATPTIVGEIRRHFRDKGWTIRVPRRIQELSQRINVARAELPQILQRTPTVKDLAEHLEHSEEEILEAMEGSQVYSPRSLDLKYDGGEDSDVSLGDLIGVEEGYYRKIEDNEILDQLMSILDETERKIMVDRYYNKRTQSSIAEDLGVSQMTISRLERKILEKMKTELERS